MLQVIQFDVSKNDLDLNFFLAPCFTTRVVGPKDLLWSEPTVSLLPLQSYLLFFDSKATGTSPSKSQCRLIGRMSSLKISPNAVLIGPKIWQLQAQAILRNNLRVSPRRQANRKEVDQTPRSLHIPFTRRRQSPGRLRHTT